MLEIFCKKKFFKLEGILRELRGKPSRKQRGHVLPGLRCTEAALVTISATPSGSQEWSTQPTQGRASWENRQPCP